MSSCCRPELQPAFFWYFHLPEPGLCWPWGIAWIASFQAKSELMKNSSAALKTKLKQSNIFLRCPRPTFFLSGRDDRECVSSPKSQIRDFMSLGFLFDLFWAGRLNPNTRSGERKQRSEPTHTEGGKRRQDFGRPSSCVARIYLRTSDSCWKSCSTFSVFLPPPASLFGFVALLLGRSEWQ